MIEEANTKILDRYIPKQDIETHFKEQLELLQEIVNYGTNLIPRSFCSSEKKLCDVIVIGILLKQVVSMLDAVEILVSQGAVYSAQIPARVLFEAFLYIQWILKEDSERRAKQYYVWDLRERRHWDQKIISGTEENKHLSEISQKNPFFKMPAIDKQKEAMEEKAAIDNILGSQDYIAINREFEHHKYRSWHQPWKGPSSIRDMAGRLELAFEYEFIYSTLSKAVHSSDVRKSIRFENERMIFEPIRQLEGIDTLLRIIIVIAMETYRVILGKFRYEEKESFAHKYIEEWKNRFGSMKGVKYNVSQSRII